MGAFSPTHGSTMLHSLVYINIYMNHINQSNLIRAKFTRITLKSWTNHLTPFKCHFGRLVKMAALIAKIQQVFKVGKFNPQREEIIKTLLHLIKLNNEYTYWYYLSHLEYDNCKRARLFITFHNNTCWFRHVDLKSAPPKQKSNTHTLHSFDIYSVTLFIRRNSSRRCNV